MKAKVTYFSMALLIAFLLLGCTSDDESSYSSSSLVPQAPLGDKTQYLDIGSTISDIVVEGSDINWYSKRSDLNTEVTQTNSSNLSDMTWLPADTEAKNGVTYYATQTVRNVQSRTFLAVTVYIYQR